MTIREINENYLHPVVDLKKEVKELRLQRRLLIIGQVILLVALLFAFLTIERLT